MNLFNRLSLKSIFLIAPLIGLVLILILFFSSFKIIRTDQILLHDLNEKVLPQISELALVSTLLLNHHSKLTILLVSAEKVLDEENVYIRGRKIVDEFYVLIDKFEHVFSEAGMEYASSDEAHLLLELQNNFQQYKNLSLDAIELSTVNVELALSELAVANEALDALNEQLLMLTEQRINRLSASAEKIKFLYGEDSIIVLTIAMVFIMLYLAVYFSSRIAQDIKQINDALVGLSQGKKNIFLPETAGFYIENLTTIVQKLKDTLQQNVKHEKELQRSIIEINESQSRYYQMFETNQAVKLIIDMESGIIVEANEAASTFYGYDAKTLTSMNISDINISDYTDIKKNMSRAKETGSVFNFRHKLSTGAIRDVEVYSGPIQSAGKTLLYSIIHDVTERNLAVRSLSDSERKYRSIIQSTVVAIVVADKSGYVQEWNMGAEHVFGYSANEVLGKPLALLMPERFKQLHDKGFVQAISHESLVNSEALHEVSGVRKNGEEFPLELTLGSWQTGDDIFFSAMIVDISQRKRAELGLRRSQKMDAIGQLTGGIAHDFNNILGVILGNVDLLERQIANDAKLYKRIDSIKRSAQRAADLTRQLLGFSRRETETVSVVNLNTLIDNMQSLISRSLTPQVEVTYQYADDLWNTAIDAGDFEDALLNLILNARDAMSGRGHITIETSNKELDEEYCKYNEGVTPGGYVELVISDDGEGISPELQERIFEPFFTTKEQGKGTGLGLAMVFGFVQRSKGNIRIYSEPGIGTTFRVFLPKVADQVTVQEQAEEAGDYLPGGSETILAVDDEAGLLEVAGETLRSLGYTIMMASNAQQALEYLEQENDIALLFSDVVMPGMNGYELAELAVKKHPSLKVLLTSGYTEKAVANNTGFIFEAKLLSKPYTQTVLARSVREILDGN